jgi:hypothetical protein
VSQWNLCILVSLVLLQTVPLWGQLDTGVLRVVVVDARGQPVSGVVVAVRGTPAVYVVQARSGTGGLAEFVLPYGEYRLSSSEIDIDVPPLQTACAEVVIDTARAVERVREIPCSSLTAREDRPFAVKLREEQHTGSDTLHGLLLGLEPATVTEPLNFSGLSSMRLPLLSQRALSWTAVRYG